MGTKTYELIDSIVNILDVYGYDPLPSNERSGSMWFKPHDELVFKRQMPKGKVFIGDYSQSVDDKSMGNVYKIKKTITLNCVVFTTKGDTDPSTGKKDRDLVDYLLDDIQTQLKTHKISEASLLSFGVYDGPDYDKVNNIFVGVLPVTYHLVE